MGKTSAINRDRVTLVEAAKLIGISKSALKHHIRAGRLKTRLHVGVGPVAFKTISRRAAEAFGRLRRKPGRVPKNTSGKNGKSR
jgi:hypothetical protein